MSVSEPNQDRISIVIADDHVVVRAGLRMLLDAEPGFCVTGETGDMPSTYRSVAANRPTVLILDLNMPGEPSLPGIPYLRSRHPETQIVVLTMQNDPAFAREALRAGAVGYVLKEAADNELVQAVRLAAEGKTYLHPTLGARLVAEPTYSHSTDRLTERELEVLRLIALGYTNNQIAGHLYLSIRTVESHRAHIQHKLGLSSRSELVQYALDRNLVEH